MSNQEELIRLEDIFIDLKKRLTNLDSLRTTIGFLAC